MDGWCFASRTPVSYLQTHFSSFAPSTLFLTFIGIATLVEELMFRGFVQERVSWFYNDYFAIIVGALLMSFFLYSTGELLVVMVIYSLYSSIVRFMV